MVSIMVMYRPPATAAGQSGSDEAAKTIDLPPTYDSLFTENQVTGGQSSPPYNMLTVNIPSSETTSDQSQDTNNTASTDLIDIEPAAVNQTDSTSINIVTTNDSEPGSSGATNGSLDTVSLDWVYHCNNEIMLHLMMMNVRL